MPKPRKTLEVDKVRKRINRMIEHNAKHDPYDTKGREALMTVIEAILLDTNNYKGFGYNDFDGDETNRYYY